MKTRSTLNRELQTLNDKTLQMASMVNEALDKAMHALISRDVLTAREIMANDTAVNELRYDIEDLAIIVIATQQPMARDLRWIIAAIHIAVELERIGDHAADIASLAERVENEGDFDTLHKLPKMANRAGDMVQTAVTAFIQQDAEMARKIIRRDEKLDRHYRLLRQETLAAMVDDDYIRRANFFFFFCHDLERIGDRATNIAERVIFMITNEHIELTERDDS